VAIQNPTIIVPGIKGSSLENFYSLEPDATWSEVDAAKTMFFGPTFDDLALDPTAQFDRGLNVVTRANGVLPIAYASLVSALRQRREMPVYVFPYDWRYSIEAAAAKLEEFAKMIRAKIKVAKPGWSGKIDFVCHSMGGLVFRSFLRRFATDEIGRVVFMAVPHRGSLDAVEAMIRGETTLFGGRKEMRKLARTFPGVYELLPRFTGAVVDGAGRELDIFQEKNWQVNVTPLVEPEKNGFDVQQQHLSAALRALNHMADPLAESLDSTEMLTIYGVKPKSTLVQVPVADDSESKNRDYKFDARPRGDGDGVVPKVSAVFTGIPSIRLTWDDVSYFTETIARFNFHAFIGTLDETKSIIARFLDGENGVALLPRGLSADRYEETE